MDYIRQVAPEATKLAIDSSISISNGKVACDAIDYLIRNIPDFLGTASHKKLMSDKAMMAYYKQLYDRGCFLVCTAGNKQKEIRELARGDLWKAIGACNYNNGNPKVEWSYVDDEEMDYCSLHNLKASYDNKKHKGTSFSYPILIGMLALVQCFFKEKTGKKLNHENLEKFVIDNCIDLEEKGHDVKTGHGLFILPEPETINIYKYGDVKMFKDNTQYEKAIEYLAEQNEMDSPIMWKERIKKDNDVNLMWFCVKWANAVSKNK